MRYLLALLFLISMALPAYANGNLSQFPAAGTLLGSEPVFAWQGNKSVQTTTGAIAALAGTTSGGGNVGTSSPTQVLYNNGGTVGGIKTLFYVQAYGAKCDGHILQTGVIGSNGSNDISSYDYAFTSADVGAIITITNPGPANTYFQKDVFTSTIASVSGNGHAQLAGNLSLSQNLSYPGLSARWYHTDDSVAIQNALNAGAALNFMAPSSYTGGGNIRFPSSVCVGANLVFYSNEEISGESESSSIVMLPANANTDLFKSFNYAQTVAPWTGNTTGVSNTNGTVGVTFENLTLDGNRGSNTGSGSGLTTGTGSDLRWRGSHKRGRNLQINFAAGDGMFLQGADGPGTPFYTFYNSPGLLTPPGSLQTGLEYSDGFEDFLDDVVAFYDGGWGIVDDGCGDSEYMNIWTSANGAGGILDESTNNNNNSPLAANGSPLKVFNYHGYSETTDIDVETQSMECDFCDLEVGGIINGSAAWNNSRSRAGLQLGKIGGSANFSATDSSVWGTLTVVAVPNNGAADVWINSSIGGGISGTYLPNVRTNSTGFGTQSINVSTSNAGGSTFPGGGPFVINNCNRFSPNTCLGASQLNVTTSGMFQLGTGLTNTYGMAMDTSQNVAFGPNVASVGTGLGADFTRYTNGLGLPTGTLAQRPACVGSNAGSIRFDITTGQPEFCTGNGSWTTLGTGTVSLSVPNQFLAGQSVPPATVTPSGNNFTPNFATSNNFILTLNHNTSNVLVNPANFVPGQSGLIYVIQSGSGSDTFGGGYGNYYIFAGGTAPTLSTAASAIDVFSYTTVIINATNYVLINPSLNFHN